MLEVLQFIFSSFWIWLGTVILIGATGWALHHAFLGLRGVRADESDDKSASKTSL